ncbi:hypothetical protein FrEUN1fDRAFT_7100 [Parafrankia sp. EUN1f]|nr:hypothetical protein FrEUN1fDRAFT_7100 [Parafrankia sp. EUN1f]
MTLSGAYEPSPFRRGRDQIALYEATGAVKTEL